METFEKGITSGVIDQSDLNDLNKMRESIGFEERKTPIERPGMMGGMGDEEGGLNGAASDGSPAKDE
jgi:hypothetical protein